ncbi:MAG: Sip1-related alpha-galactosidase [Candidatus Sigynarchaeota archaeon]
MNYGNIEIRIDESSGDIEIFYRSTLVFSAITPVLFYNDEWLSEKTGELAFEKIAIQSGGSGNNYEGNPYFPEYHDFTKVYLVKNGNEQFSCTLHVVVFPKNQAIYFTMNIEGNDAKSNQIGGFIDLGVPQGVSRYRFFHAGNRQARVEKPPNATPRMGMGFFIPYQTSWQHPEMAGLLPDNESLPISYLLGQLGGGIVSFVPVDRFGQITTIRACSFLDFPNGVKFVSGNFLNAQKYDRLAGGLVAFGEDPIELSETIFRIYMQLINRVHAMREKKEYPEIFEYLGFCTWNTFYQAVDMQGIKDLLEENFTSKCGSDRFKYLIVDDGWQSINGMTSTSDKEIGSNKTGRGLRKFEANYKFPNDIGEVVRLAKLKYRVRWVGVWHAVGGYWDGVEPNSDLGRRYPLAHNVPDPSFFKGFEFWHDYYAHLRAQGIDFLKIDNQSALAHYLQGIGPVDTMIDQYYDMQQGAAYSQNLAVLNCMCMPTYCYTHWKISNVSRVSDDFGPGNLAGLKHQVMQCVFNPLSYGQFCYPDHDMVWTKPAKNGCPVHPLLLVHAVSGGPIYIADEIGETDGKVIEKLSFPDGRIPRLEGVSMPTVDSIFADTERDAACKAWNYDDIPGWGRVFYYFMANVVKDDNKPISASISIADMGTMAYAGNTIPAEHVIKDVETSFARTVSAENERVKTDLAPLQAKYYKISPVIRGIALLGISDVYNGTKDIERAAWENDKTLFVNLKYPGTLELYAKNPDWVTVKNMAGMNIPVQRDPLNPQLVRFHVDSACQIFLA